MARFCTSAISSFVTSQGPMGAKLSWLLPLVHCPDRRVWNSRSETSLPSAKPATWSMTSSSPIYCAFEPMTTTSSTSQSSMVESTGLTIGSFGPVSAVTGFWK